MGFSWSVDITRLKKVIIISLLVLFYAKYRGMGITKIPSLGYEGLVDWLLLARSGSCSERDFSGKCFPKTRKRKKEFYRSPIGGRREKKFLWLKIKKEWFQVPHASQLGQDVISGLREVSSWLGCLLVSVLWGGIMRHNCYYCWSKKKNKIFKFTWVYCWGRWGGCTSGALLVALRRF